MSIWNLILKVRNADIICVLYRHILKEKIMDNKISVIVTISNSIEYLRLGLDSICNQTYENLEIILVDDGSTDGSGLVCDEFGKADERVKVIHINNGGVVNARKIGCKASTGEYISIVDSDDWLEPNMLEKLIKSSIEQNVDVSMCGRIEEYPTFHKEVRQGFDEGRYSKEQLLSVVYPNMIVNKSFFEWGIFPSYWDKLFKRDSIIPYISEIDESIPMGNDAAGVYPALLNADSIVIRSDCLYHYRQYQNSLVHREYDRHKISKGFQTLYFSVNEQFERSKDIFDFREQWKKYVLFLMTPRADMLYQNLDKLSYLFPFPKAKKDSRIVIYGMGVYGKRLYRYIENTGFCKLVISVDKNYKDIVKTQYRVIPPEEINNYEFDYVVVTLSFAGVRANVYEYLKSFIPVEKICLIDENEIFSEKTMRAFGLY